MSGSDGGRGNSSIPRILHNGGEGKQFAGHQFTQQNENQSSPQRKKAFHSDPDPSHRRREGTF